MAILYQKLKTVFAMYATKLITLTDDQRAKAIMKIKNQVRRDYSAQVV
jgi:hypothetical protein